ncbi:hypothetical protein M1446_00685 [Candidatus Dependentiae bacterium]|nr:hypothetical protein [Candidatus Dependentiae bacterium]
MFKKIFASILLSFNFLCATNHFEIEKIEIQVSPRTAKKRDINRIFSDLDNLQNEHDQEIKKQKLLDLITQLSNFEVQELINGMVNYASYNTIHEETQKLFYKILVKLTT